MNKREFLQNTFRAMASVAAACIPYGLLRLISTDSTALASGWLRPPGAFKDDAEFVQSCIGCGLCSEVCPPDCIKFHRSEGGNEVNTPYIIPHEKACTLCGKCMQVCPTNALTPVPRDDVDMGIAQIDRSACYPWVDRGICGACVSICPLGTDAISFNLWSQYQPVVHHDCVGCGLCVEVCPHPSLPIRIVDRTKGTIMKHNGI